MVKINNASIEDNQIISELMESHDFDELKPTQRQAFSEGVLNDNNSLLIAETGNGKTLCAEAIAKKKLKNNNKVAYLVPSTQLVRDKKETIEEWDEDIDVSSGSGKYYHGDVVVATFNSFYQAIIRDVGSVREFDVAILDDFHELYGDFIGPGLEKSIAAIKQYNIDIFAMSATIGNSEDISNWLDSDLIISDEERSIPIEEKIGVSDYNSKKDAVSNLVSNLSDKKPILVFNYAKSWCESRAKAISDKTDYKNPDTNVEKEIEKRIGDTIPKSLNNLVNLMNSGVAYHHSSLPKQVRELIEDMYQNGDLKCICATTTIAYGFDAPVQTVVVADMKRRGTWVGKWEYQQWIGRAARPGFGYNKGYAYVVTTDSRTVKNQYFKPRDLEPIDTHISSQPQFRKLILELISTGWDTPDDIEEFLEETLLWELMSTSGSWGRSFGSKSEQIKSKLRETANWLEEQNFISENRTSRSFDVTDKGESAVEFSFNVNTSVTLSDINNMYRWYSEQDNITEFKTLCSVCDIFSLGISKRNTTRDIETKIRNSGFQVNRSTITAGIIDSLWIKNRNYDQIEDISGANATYLSNKSYRISNVLEESSMLIKNEEKVPKWFNHYPYRVSRGINLDSVPYVKNVRGLGRKKVKSLREYLNNRDQTDKSNSLHENINTIIGDDFVEEISSNVEGVGDKIAASILKYHKNNNIPEIFNNNDRDKKTLSDF